MAEAFDLGGGGPAGSGWSGYSGWSGQSGLSGFSGATWFNSTKVYQPSGVSQSLPSGSWTTWSAWSGQEWDIYAQHSTSTNPSRITVSKRGYYRVTAQGLCAIMAEGQVFGIRINRYGSASDISAYRMATYAGTPGSLTPSSVIHCIGSAYCEAGDYFEVQMYTSAPASWISNASELLNFEVTLMGGQGDSGLSGLSGFSAYSGATGLSGWSGWSGAVGTSGFSGQSAWSGVSAWSGLSGISGWSGESGISGWSGVSGQEGMSGWSGTYSGWSGWSGESGFSGVVGFSGTSGFSGSFENVGQIMEIINAKGDCTGDQTIDLALGNIVTAKLTGSGTWTITNAAPAGKSSTVTFLLQNAGAFTITWAVVPKWPGGAAPTWTASGYDILVLMTVDSGTTWYASSVPDLG